MKSTDATVQTSSVKIQYLTAAVVNLIPIGYGFACGWPSPNLPILREEGTPLPSGPIGIQEGSLIAAFLCVGGFIGNFLFGFLTSRFGRKLPLLSLAVPSIASWLLIIYAQNVNYLYAARILSGCVGGGIFVIIPQFLSEIASDRVRGILGSTICLSCNSGLLFAFIMGAFCDYYAAPKLVIALTCLFLILILFFPESPSFLIKQNKISEAEKSVRFYQNIREDDTDLLHLEMKNLMGTFGTSTENANKNSLSLSDFKTREARKAFIIGVVLSVLNQFCGMFAMINYTATIMKEAGTTMLPNTSAIVVGAIQLVGSYAATNLVDRTGRKFLFAVSTIGTALGLITLGTYMMLKSWNYEVESFNWIPVASFSFCIFVANFAILNLPFLVISEIMPQKLKDFGSSFCVSMLWTSGFIFINYMPTLTDTLGMHGSMFFFSTICLWSAAFLMWYLPETKGRSYDEIMQLMRK